MVIAFFCALTGSLLLGRLLFHLELIPWRATAQAHWAIRAQQLYPVRVAASLNGLLLPLLGVLVGWVGWRAPWGPLVLGGLIGTKLSGYWCDREVAPEIAPRAWLHFVAATFLLGSLRWLALGAAIVFMPAEFGPRGWAITVAYVLFFLSAETGRLTKLFDWLRLRRPAPRHVQEMVAASAVPAGIEVRAVWELLLPYANAVAFTATRELAFTTALLQHAPADELRAICAHELGHLAESRWILLGRIVGAMGLLPLIFLRPIHARFPTGGVQVLMIVGGALWWLGSRLGQVMEKRADQHAVEATADPLVYARALENIYRLNRMPVVQNKRALHTHPDLYDRMIAAGVTPDYARPDPPSHVAYTSILLASACAYLGISIALK